MTRITTVGAIAFILSITGCSDSNSSSKGGSAKDPVPDVPPAAAINATATYATESAGAVIDADTTEATFWAGNITDDSVTVDYGSIKSYSGIEFFVSDTSTDSSKPTYSFEISEDGQTYLTTAVFFGRGDVGCNPLEIRRDRSSYNCTFYKAQSFRYVRVTIKGTSEIGLLQVREIVPTEAPN